MAKTDDPTFGATWAKQDPAKGSPIGVLPDEEQVSDPEEDIDPETELDEPASIVKVLPDGREVDGDGEIHEPATATGVISQSDEPVIQCFASIKKHSVVDGSSGLTLSLGLEVDTAFADDFVSLMEDATYSAEIDKYQMARDGVTVKSVNTSENGGEKKTAVSLHVTQDQLGLFVPVAMMVGKYLAVEIFRTQLTMDLTKRAE